MTTGVAAVTLPAVTTPDEVMGARTLLLLHVPPDVALVYPAMLPEHIVAGPAMAAGIAFTVIIFVAVQPVGRS